MGMKSSHVLPLVLAFSLLTTSIHASEPVGPPAPVVKPAGTPVTDQARLRAAQGRVKIVLGVLLIPLGGLIALFNSLERCDPDPDAFNIGPCSEEGPSTGGQLLGAGVAMAGVAMIISGARDLPADSTSGSRATAYGQSEDGVDPKYSR
ncbi:MAG: hypothetical protein JWP91_2655 [Fibrobacteres bacterium]|nr:hypothetical protein [Fibrobacterota bacterium]